MSKPAIRTPSSIRGGSLAELHAQRRADTDLQELLASDKPGAAYKAFAQGMAAGATIPLLMQSSGIVAQVQGGMASESAKLHVAHWLQGQGVTKDVAHRQASGVYRLLMAGAGGEASKAIQESRAGGWGVKGGPAGQQAFSSRAEAVDMATRWRVSKGANPILAEAAAKVRDVYEIKPKGEVAKMSIPSGSGAKKILHIARESYEQAGKASPGFFRVGRKMLPSIASRALPGVLTLGLAGGVTNVLRTRKRRQEAHKLLRRGASR